MKNVNFRRAARKGSLLAHPFPKPSLMCSLPTQLNVQPTGLAYSAACQPALWTVQLRKIHGFHLATKPSI